MKTKPASPKGQCQFAETAKDKPRCQKPATRLWGGNWFCDEHGTETCIIMTNERTTDTTLSDLLQSCHSLFLKIADEDDKEQFQINQDLRRTLDALCLKIQQTI